MHEQQDSCTASASWQQQRLSFGCRRDFGTLTGHLSTSDCAVQVHEATIEAGAYPSPLNYYNFPKSVCTSVNEVIVGSSLAS